MNRTETLDHGTRVFTAPGAGFGSDALLLARFAAPRPQERAADLCSGCGIVALAWHDAGHRGPCAAVELDPAASALCAAALRENGIAHITALCADVRAFCRAGPEQGRYDFAACNPPYFTAGPRSPARLEPKRLAFARQRADSVPWLFLVEAQKGRRPGLRMEPDLIVENGAARYGTK